MWRRLINPLKCKSTDVPNFPFSQWGIMCGRQCFSCKEEITGEEKVAEKFVDADEAITIAEAKRVMKLVNVESLKEKMGIQGKEAVPYSDLIAACKSTGITKSDHEAASFARVLDDSGVVFIFRDKVYLHPDKIVDLVRKALPLALRPENDPERIELKKMIEKKQEIDVLAHKQVRFILWMGLCASLMQVGLFFRLTFWDFSWDVMEPIAFFFTTGGIVISYAFFLFTAKEPSYKDLMKKLFVYRQRKLLKRFKFDVERFNELQMKCKAPVDAATLIRKRLGLDLDLDDSIRKF